MKNRWGDELERSWSREQAVSAAIHFAHSSDTQSLLQSIAAELAGFSHLPAESANHGCGNDGEKSREVNGTDQPDPFIQCRVERNAPEDCNHDRDDIHRRS